MEIFKAFFYGNLLNVIGFYNDLWILIALTTEIVNWKIFSLLKISIFQKKKNIKSHTNNMTIF